MKNGFSARSVYTFVIVLILCLIVNYIGSLLFFDELRMSFLADALIALVAALVVYFRDLYRLIDSMEHRITSLERRLAGRN